MDISLYTLSGLCAIYLFLKLILISNKLFDTVPKGEAKQWIFQISFKYHLVIVFTNLDGVNNTWHMGVVKIDR